MKGCLWTLGGGLVGGTAGWFGVIVWLESRPRRPPGDPAGNWAQGMVHLVTALQVALAGVILGAIVGAAVHLYRKSRSGRTDGSDDLDERGTRR